MDIKEKKLANNMKYWPVYLVLVLVMGFGSYQILRSAPDMDKEIQQTTATIGRGDIRISGIGSGTLISAEENELGFEYGGVVAEILVEVGDIVEQGDLLAVLENDDLQETLIREQAEFRELSSDASEAAAALELAEAQKAVLTAESTLRFYLSPYVFKGEIRLREAERVLNQAEQNAVLNPSAEADQSVVDAQEIVDQAALSQALNWETYYEEYVPDFFNFPWRDQFGFWHDYYDPPSDTEVALAWAELSAAQARLEEAEIYQAVLVGGSISEEAFGSKITALEKTAEKVADAQEKLDASRLIAPLDGVVLEINFTEKETVGSKKTITIARLDPPTLEVSFDEGDWALVKEGSPVEVIFDVLPERTYLGTVIFVDPTLQTRQNTTTVSALVELELSMTGWTDLPLLSGASIEVIGGESDNVVLLPIEGLQSDRGDVGTVLVYKDGAYLLKEIELGLRDVLYIEVLSGLSVGDLVLIGEY